MTALGSVPIESVVTLARSAGDVILEVYEKEYDIIEKADGSPVTTADHRAHDLIVEELSALTPDIRVVRKSRMILMILLA